MTLLSYAFGGQYGDEAPIGEKLDNLVLEESEYTIKPLSEI